jgi:hypothetical protein
VCTLRGAGTVHTLPAERLGPGPLAIADARRHVCARMAEAGARPAEVELAALLTSEVMTNAVLYAPPVGAVDVHELHDRVRITVADSSAVPPTVRGDGAEGGWGLRLLERAALGWGHHPLGAGKCVWFEVPRTVGDPQPVGGDRAG